MSQVVTKFPTTTTTIVAGWSYPENAFVEDGANAYSSTDNAEQKYGGWNFTENDIPPGSTITKVEFGAKHYEVNPSGYYQYTVLKYIRSDGLPVTVQLTKRTALTWDWWDITSYESSWDLTKLNNADCRIICDLVASGGEGCYCEDDYFLGKDEKGWIMRNPTQLKPGDLIITWSDETGLSFAEVEKVEVYEGIHEYITLYLPELKFKDRIKGGYFSFQPRATVTGVHPLLVFKKEGVERGKEYARFVLKALEVHRRMMAGEKFWIGTLWEAKSIMMLPIVRADYHQKHGKAFKIVPKDKTTKYLFADHLTPEDLQHLAKHGYGLREIGVMMPLLSQALKLTSYVDAIALRVTFTPPAAAGQYYNIGDGLSNKTVYV